MPLEQSPPFTMSDGRLKSRGQSVVRTTPARCAPEEWPETYRRPGSPPKLCAFRWTRALRRVTRSPGSINRRAMLRPRARRFERSRGLEHRQVREAAADDLE